MYARGNGRRLAGVAEPEEQAGRTGAADPRRPNFVVILADDLGYSDIGCYGSEVATPNLDALAGSGLRFSQAYNCARCCPTRAALLTGLYPHQAGVGHMVGNYGIREYQGYLRDDCVTIAEALKGGGYRTMMAGKWHVGGGYQANRPETWRPGTADHPLPVQRGFDTHYGMLGGGGSYFNPPSMVRDDQLIEAAAEAESYYLTDAISDRAVTMVEQATAAEAPFFLYVAYTAPHWPLHALPDDIARYEGRYRDGWDAVRTARHEQLKGLGVLDRRWGISPRDPESRPWGEAHDQVWEDRRMAVYAAQIECMDRGIGRIMGALRRAGVAEDTLVLFLSDNGGCAEFLAEESASPEPFRYDIPTPDGRPMRIGNTPAVAPGPDDTFQSYDLPWANASNAPFRLFKHWVHEGGIATPLVASWPRVIERTGITHQPVHVIDIFPTLLEAAGIPLPERHAGRTVTPVEGESLLSLLSGVPWRRDRPIFFEHEGNRAVRDGKWKLVSRHPDSWELYDMHRDRTELHDLAAARVDEVARLAGLHNDWARRCGVLPWHELQQRSA